jgi:hypothetical protein
MVGFELAAAGALGLMAINVVVGTPIAFAACHHFTVTASPATVAEGAKVTVTVTRDAAVRDSRIDVSTVDETAKAGTDYQAMHRTVSFTGSSTAQSFPLQTLDDHRTGEGNETFRLHLSNPAGCNAPVQPFVVDPDARVTIQDEAATATTAPANTRTAAPGTTRTTRASSASTAAQSTSTSEATTTTETSLETTTATGVATAPITHHRSSRTGWAIGAVVGLIAVGGGTGLWLSRRRR